jgi:hypothetical protein
LLRRFSKLALKRRENLPYSAGKKRTRLAHNIIDVNIFYLMVCCQSKVFVDKIHAGVPNLSACATIAYHQMGQLNKGDLISFPILIRDNFEIFSSND